MNKLIFTLLGTFMLLWSVAATAEARFVSDPSLSPDGRTIVFSYETDLWKVDVQGGNASRITGMAGREFLPRFSPDGRWIAFSATVDGNTNIFVVPAQGGEIRQLTFHQSDDLLESWTWDSRYVYFSSNRANMNSIYKVALDGGTPVRLFDHYFNVPHHLAENPVSGDFIFTDSWESLRFAHRKRYVGAHNPDLLSYNPKTKAFSKLTQYEGKDMWPTVDRQGNLYFASDELNKEYNLYALRDNAKTSLTSFQTSIGRPQVSADGSKIVFEKDYQIMVYDVASGKTNTPDIKLYQQNSLSFEQSFQVKGNITTFDVSPDKKKLAFVSRGELFVSDVEGKFVRQVVTNPLERVTEVMWAHDNKTLFFLRTNNGWTNLYAVDANGKGKERIIEEKPESARMLTMSPDRKSGVYLSGRNHVMLLDAANLTTQILVTDELWGFQNSAPRFSPDGSHIVFTAFRNFEQNILVHDIKNNETIELTKTGVSERLPWWSPCGRYIYFVTDRYQANYPRGNTQDRIYRIPLQRIQADKKSERFDALFQEQDEEKNKDPEVVSIDLERIHERWEPVNVARIGKQWSPYVFRIKNEDILLFTSNHDEGSFVLWKKELTPFEDPDVVRIEGARPGMNAQVVNAGDELFMLAQGNIHKINLSQNKTEAINITHTFSRNLANEFSQIFYETWASIAENFYSDDFHGVDWEAKRDQYASQLPHVRTRQNLRVLLNDMLGELNASHTGFSSNGEEEKSFYSARIAESGIVFDNQRPFLVKEILPDSHLDLTGEPVRPGDVLVAVNGKRTRLEDNRNQLFYYSSLPDELLLTFSRGDNEFEVRVKPHTMGQMDAFYYDQWIAANREYVAEQSGGRLGYVFMKDMGQGSLEQFLIDMTTHAMNKEGLIVDIRFNRGGNVHDEVLQFLSQRPYLTWKYRGGELAPQPNFSPSGSPITLLINERSLSDAEMTAEGFRALDLGTIIGTETYRWIIFTSGKSMVDGSYCRLPSWGCYTLDGRNLEMTGVAPDIEVHNSFEDRLNNNDPQLDKAIEHLMGTLKVSEVLD
ncbi:MAG: S41 family peptidase [Bacteroidales bacterium]